MIASSINAIDIHRISWSPSADTQIEVGDVPINSISAEHEDDVDALRAQVDTAVGLT